MDTKPFSPASPPHSVAPGTSWRIPLPPSTSAIILASHRFAPEVTSAALWLNEKSPAQDLITCITLTPFSDDQSGSLYVQANTIIPAPGVDEYVIGVSNPTTVESRTHSGNSFAENMRSTKQRNRNDAVSVFAEKVSELTLQGLATDILPNKKSQYALGWPYFRHYNLWYAREPWRNYQICYFIHLRPGDEPDTWNANVGFRHQNLDLTAFDGISLHEQQTNESDSIYVRIGCDTLNDDFAGQIAGMTRKFIQQITPIVNTFEEEGNETDA